MTDREPNWLPGDALQSAGPMILAETSAQAPGGAPPTLGPVEIQPSAVKQEGDQVWPSGTRKMTVQPGIGLPDVSAVAPSAQTSVSYRGREFKRLQCYVALALSDLVNIAIAFVLGNLIYFRNITSPHGIVVASLFAPTFFCIAIVNRAYGGQALEAARWSVLRAVEAFVLSAAIVTFIAYFLKAGSDYSRAVFALGSLAGLFLVPLGRVTLSRPLLRFLGGTPYSTVLIRDGADFGAQPHDVSVSAEDLNFDVMTRDPVDFHLLANRVAYADRVVVACPSERHLAWSSVLKSMAVDGEILSGEQDALGIIGVRRYGGHQSLVVSAGRLRLRERLLKRTLDLCLSIGGLIVLGVPLLLVAVAIRLDSPGPALFRQDRIGLDNRIFRMFKFRSMYSDRCDSDAATLTARNDSRVTRVGEFIRRTSIDELPQLINVLLGEMSIVGPRPHAIAAKADNILYWDIDARYRHRHCVKPGLTGLAQVRGFRGATNVAEDLTNRLQSDLEYVAKWSLLQDLWIIGQTVAVVRHQNAF